MDQYEYAARQEGWVVTLNHNGVYVAHDEITGDTEPCYILTADTYPDAWRELCTLEGIDVG